MESIRIRAYQPQDWPALCTVHDEARRQELRLAGLDEAFLPLPVAAEREGLFEYPHLDVAVHNGRPVGFCAYTGEELAWLYVAPPQHRRGIGRALVANALRQEPALCCIEVLKGNEPARRLYESFGFAVDKLVSGRMPGNESFAVQVWAMSRSR